MDDSVTREVDFSQLAHQLELTRQQRWEILRDGLVTPVNGRTQGRPTKITPEDAERLQQAKQILDTARETGPAFVVGLSVGIILRLLLSGAVKPNIP